MRKSRSQRIKREVRKRHYFWNVILRILAAPIIKAKYHFHPKFYRLKSKGPNLILVNHTCMSDPLLVGTSFDVPLYYVATEQIFNIGFLTKLLKHFFNPISKTKSLSDIGTIKKIRKIISEGGNVAIFPEGNTTYTGEMSTIPPAISKLIKFLKVPVIFYKTQGLYLSNPRWSVNRKYAKTTATITRILQPEDFDKLSNEDLLKLVEKEMYYNCYEDQRKKQIRYKGKKRAVGLERLLFTCPRCHKQASLTSTNNNITCDNCGYDGYYNEFGYLINEQIGNKSLIELEAEQREYWCKYLDSFKGDVICRDHGFLEISYPDRKDKYGNITIQISPTGVEISGDKFYELFKYGEIVTVAIQGKSKLIIYLSDAPNLLIQFDNKISPYKYFLTCQYYKLQYNTLKDNETFNITADQLGL